MRTVTQVRGQGFRLTMTTVLEDHDYADDIGLLSSKYMNAQRKAEHLIKTAYTIGLNVGTKKTQVLRKYTTVNHPVVIDGKHLKDVEEFTYLGTKVTTTGECDQKFNALINKDNKSFAMLKPVWRTTNLSVYTKINIFRSNVLSVLLCGAECWKTTIAIHRKLEVFQTKYF